MKYLCSKCSSVVTCVGILSEKDGHMINSKSGWFFCPECNKYTMKIEVIYDE